MKENNKYRSIGIMIFQVAFAVCLLIFLFLRLPVVSSIISKLNRVLSPIYIGLVLCYLTAPFYNMIKAHMELKNSKGAFPKVSATFFSGILIILIIYGVIALIIPQVMESIISLYNQIPMYIERCSSWINSFFSKDFQFKEELLELNNSLAQYLSRFVESIVIPNMDKIASSVFLSVKSVALWVYNLVIGIIAALYLLNFKDELIPRCKKLLYAFLKKDTADILLYEINGKGNRFSINSIFGGFLKGKLLDSLIIGILCFIGLSILRMPYALLVSVIVGVTNIIPYFGPFIGAIPSTFIITIVSPQKGLFFVIFVFILQQIDGNVIGPKILGESIGLNSFWVLFSILLFGGMLGFIGMLIAVPTWAFAMSLVKKIAEKRLKAKGLPVDTGEYENNTVFQTGKPLNKGEE